MPRKHSQKRTANEFKDLPQLVVARIVKPEEKLCNAIRVAFILEAIKSLDCFECTGNCVCRTSLHTIQSKEQRVKLSKEQRVKRSTDFYTYIYRYGVLSNHYPCQRKDYHATTGLSSTKDVIFLLYATLRAPSLESHTLMWWVLSIALGLEIHLIRQVSDA